MTKRAVVRFSTPIMYAGHALSISETCSGYVAKLNGESEDIADGLSRLADNNLTLKGLSDCSV